MNEMLVYLERSQMSVLHLQCDQGNRSMDGRTIPEDILHNLFISFYPPNLRRQWWENNARWMAALLHWRLSWGWKICQAIELRTGVCAGGGSKIRRSRQGSFAFVVAGPRSFPIAHIVYVDSMNSSPFGHFSCAQTLCLATCEEAPTLQNLFWNYCQFLGVIPFVDAFQGLFHWSHATRLSRCLFCELEQVSPGGPKCKVRSANPPVCWLHWPLFFPKFLTCLQIRDPQNHLEMILFWMNRWTPRRVGTLSFFLKDTSPQTEGTFWSLAGSLWITAGEPNNLSYADFWKLYKLMIVDVDTNFIQIHWRPP